ncbi:hypothetical protein EVAR_77601_1 [Eumeta japonica]|uniref:Uncharacterized protein n=1 Tax=Eumeta variegata TaxID=151549 RepID=A0A4C1T9F9_EUMVA|nr:hypothetical protein EVAR_77601_1 [Eumeta japonica]
MNKCPNENLRKVLERREGLTEMVEVLYDQALEQDVIESAGGDVQINNSVANTTVAYVPREAESGAVVAEPAGTKCKDWGCHFKSAPGGTQASYATACRSAARGAEMAEVGWSRVNYEMTEGDRRKPVRAERRACTILLSVFCVGDRTMMKKRELESLLRHIL